MWLDYVDFGDYSLKAVQSEVGGMDLQSKDLSTLFNKLGMTKEDDQKLLAERIFLLRESPHLSFSSSFSNSMLSLQVHLPNTVFAFL